MVAQLLLGGGEVGLGLGQRVQPRLRQREPLLLVVGLGLRHVLQQVGLHVRQVVHYVGAALAVVLLQFLDVV